MIFDIIPSNTVKLLEGYMPMQMLSELAIFVAGFTQRGYHLGHVTGHSIGMTMIEHPKIGEGIETELAANMIFSMHPHAISADGRECLYMQDTWHVTESGGVPLAGLEMRIW